MRRKIWYVLALLMVAVSAAADSLTNLTEITDPDDADLMYVVDVSQTTGSKLRSKKCTISSLKTEFGGLADQDYTDFTCLSDSCTLDADVVGTAEIADADFGDWTCSSGSCSLDGDVIDETNLADDSIDSEHYNDASIDAAHLAADVIDESKLADDSIDSEHYNDASIDAAHLAADVIDESKLADDSIDSEHYNDASIDPAHLNISNAETDEYVLSYEGDTSNFQWIELTSGGDIQAVGECTTGECTADFINGTDIVDDAVDSEHINDGAIDEPHLNAANSPTDEYVLSYEGDTSNFQWVEMTGGGLSADSVLESHLKAVDSASDEECLTYETTTGDFEWQSCGTGTAESLDEIDDPGDDTSLTVGDYEVEWWSNHDQGTRQYVHVMYDTDTSKTYATTLLRIGNADVDDPNVTFLETGTGNPQTAWTGNFSVGAGGAVWSNSSIEGASVIYTGANASPDEAGELVWDNTITGLDQGGLKWYDGDETRELIDLDYSVGVRESGDDGLFVRYNWNGGAGYYDLAAASGSSTTFYAEDGDGTEVAITNAKEWKFVEGAGIDIDWTDTSDGTDGDPYDLTVTVATTQVINAINPSGAMTIGDGGDTLAINTSDWDIATDGAITGASGAISQWTNDSGYTTTTDQVGTLTTGDLCVNNGTTVECTVNTEAELETALDGTNLLTSTEGAAAYEAIDSAITKTDEAETITADWVNTANPWADNEVADTITASNYLPLAGGTLTGEVVVDNLGLEFTAGDDHADCTAFASGAGIYYDDSENKFKKCMEGSATDLDTTGAGATGTLTTIKENNVQVGGSDIVTLDFLGADFDLAEDPDTEIQVVAAAALTRDTEWDTESEVQTAWGSVNILLETEIDASSELRALMDDETGTGGGLVFAESPTLVTPTLGAATAGSLNNSEGAITNVGDIGLDSISADADNGAFYVGDGADQPIIRLDGSPASDDTYSGTVITSLNCGESVAQWDLVYMDGTANEWMLTDANASGKCPALGMAVAACTDGNPGTILVQGVVRNSGWSWSNEGIALYVDDATPGAMTATAPSDSGDCVQHVARVLAVTDDTIFFNPNTLWVTIE